MPKKIKIALTPFQKLLRSQEGVLKKLEAQLAGENKQHEAEVAKLRQKITARKEVISKMKS